MANQKNKRFILGENIPIWIEQFSKAGRIKFEYDEEFKNIISATIQSPTGPKKVNIGDTIVRASSGLIVIPKTNSTNAKGGN